MDERKRNQLRRQTSQAIRRGKYKQMQYRKRKKRRLSPSQRKRRRRRKKYALLGLAAAFVVLTAVALVSLIRFVFSLFSPSVPEQTASAVPLTEVQSETAAPAVYPEVDFTIGCTGCFLLHSPFMTSYPDENGNYDFSSIFRYIAPYYSEPDFMTAEFEGSLGGPERGYSGHPMFNAPDVIIENMEESGIDLQFLATNHIYDSLEDGFFRTLSVYEEKQIAHTGARASLSEKPYYIAQICGVSVGFLNYVYETPGDGVHHYLNGMLLDDRSAALINTFQYDSLEPFYREVEQSIAQMEEEGVSFFVMNIHWGEEYQLVEAQYQDEIAQKLCDLGIDAIIGGHPHVIQPIDVLTSTDGARKTFCIYSTGNALSNQRTYLMDEMPTGHTEDGVMVTLSLHQSADGTVSITDVSVLPTWVYRFQDNGSKYYIFPLDDVAHLEENTGVYGIYAEAQASFERTMDILSDGLAKCQDQFSSPPSSENPAFPSIDPS